VAALMGELGTGGFALSQGALARLRAEFDSARASEEETRAAIAETWRATGEVVCPHTAVGIHAARARRGDPAVPMVVLATAHAAKFPDAVEAACGLRPELPARLADLMRRPERVTRVPNDLAAIEQAIAGEVVR
jgi:threonine synthase